ncbi:MAG: hypothetical protein M3O46_14750 [Myxococcota bacterium]|nr:hypothetical protein [Myxococcota bacterium]
MILVHCDSPHTPLPDPQASTQGAIRKVERLLGVDAGGLELATDPPAPPGDLQTEIDRFTTVDACVQQRARVDPVIGDALEAIGYDTFLRDACRVLDAAKAKDSRRCDAIDASLLRERCTATVAEIIGDPDVCPWQISTRPDRGRNGACVAIALRDPRLCVTDESLTAAAACEAISKHDPSPCRRLLSRSDQTRCVRDANRWYGAIPADKTTPSGLLGPSGKLQVSGPDGGIAVESDLAADAARGVVLVQHLDETHFIVGPLSEAGVGFIAASPHVRATLALQLVVPRGGSARIERVEVIIPGHAPLSMAGARSTVTAKIDKLESMRGGEVRFSISGDIDSEGTTRRVHADVSTFVRDVVSANAIYGVKLRRLGTGVGMR